MKNPKDRSASSPSKSNNKRGNSLLLISRRFHPRRISFQKSSSFYSKLQGLPYLIFREFSSLSALSIDFQPTIGMIQAILPHLF